MHLVTGNARKLEETRAILGEDLKSINLDLPELQGESPEDISKQKCLLAWNEVTSGKQHEEVAAVITEDTSLCFHALGGLPGPYIKWFFDKLGSAGLPKLLAAYEDKKASAMCCISYMDTTLEEPVTFVGSTEGTIVQEARLSGGKTQAFGWDPIFLPHGYDHTFAEMAADEKNKISHRKKALERLRAYLRDDKKGGKRKEAGSEDETREPSPKRQK